MLKYSANFYLANKNVPITNVVLTLALNGKRYKYNMSAFKIEPENWNFESQRTIKKYDRNFNLQLDRITNSINEYFKENSVINISELRQFLRSMIIGETIDNFDVQKYINIFLQSKNASTRRVYWLSLNRYFSIKNFQELDCKQLFRRIQSYSNTVETVKNVLVIIITFLNWLKNNNYYNADCHTDILKKYKKSLKLNKQKNHLVALTESELDLLYNANIENNYLQHILDSFLIQCYTGQRISDRNKINKNNIELLQEPTNNIYGYISLVSKKTKTYVKIPIFQKTFELLRRNNFRLHKAFVSTENKAIREACRLAGLTNIVTIDSGDVQKSVPKYMLITTHTARRTFITIMLRKKVPFKAIMDVAGIREIGTIMNYQKMLKDESAQLIADAFSE
jgi:integrase